MGTFFLTLDASSVYTADAPELEVLVDGVVVSSFSITAGFGTSSYSIEFAGTYPGSLSFRFNDGSTESGRSVTINNAYVNGTNVNANVSQSVLTNGQSATVTTSGITGLFGETELTLADLGAVTMQGDGDKNKLVGGATADVIDGADDNDNINGLDGDDKINGGAGNDIIRGGAGNDTILGGADNDLIKGEDGNDIIYGGAGIDNLQGGAGNDTINGGLGKDIIRGGIGDDTIFGGAGNDILRGEDGNDIIIGGADMDMLEGGNGDDLLSGGDDNDTLRGGAGADTLFGDDGNDRIFGDAGDDIIDGGAGNDLIKTGTGNHTVDGGDGNDIVKAEGGNDIINGGAGNDGLYGGAGVDTIDGGTGRDRIEGGDDNDTLNGGADNDTVLGDGGVDYVYGDDGHDRVRGGDGDDFVYGGEGNDQVFGDAGDDQVWGGNGNDLVNGNEGDDILYGEAGLDKIFGHEGNDTIHGGDDNDRIYGNEGDDIINGDDGNDTLYAASVHETISTTETLNEFAARVLSQNSNVFYNEDTGNFYQQVTGSHNYTAATSGANSATLTGFSGITGHLATITSQDESNFLQSNITSGWIRVDGNDIGNQGNWSYANGPETGTQFWQGGSTGSATGGAYTNWYGNGSYLNYNNWDTILFNAGNGLQLNYTANYATSYLVEWEGQDLLNMYAATIDTFKVMDEGATNIVNGGAGADTIYGSAGNDTLNGGTGNDAIHSGTSATTEDIIDTVLAANSGVVYSEETGSFYQYVSTGATWSVANSTANSATLTGLDGVSGHLANVTSTEESDFIVSITGTGWTWVGGTDAGNHGNWSYTSGAEAGTQYWTGAGSGSAVGGAYTNWYANSYLNQNGWDNTLFLGSDGRQLSYLPTYSTGYVIEWDASSVVNSIGTNTLNGGDGADDLYGGAGKDIFVFDNTNDVDDIFGFDDTIDVIDINDVISYDSASDVLSDFVQVTTVAGNTEISIDTNGAAGGSNFTTIASIDSVTGLDLATLVANGALIVE